MGNSGSFTRDQLLKSAAAAGAAAGGLGFAGGALASRSRRTGVRAPLCDLKGKVEGIPEPGAIPFYAYFFGAMQQAAKQGGTGIQIKIVNANNDDARQLADARVMVAQGAAAIQVMAGASSPWNPVAKEALKKGVLVFNHSPEAVNGATQNVLIDHYAAGYLNGQNAAKWINKNFGGKTEVATLTTLSSPPQHQRTEGFKAAIRKYAPKSKIWNDAAIDRNDVNKAAAAIANLLSAHPDLHVIDCYNDTTAVPAVEVLRERGKTDPKQYYVAGVDGEPRVLQLIASGKSPLQSTADFLFNFSAVQYERDIEAALCGKKIPPTRMMTPKLATVANAKQALKLADISAALDPKNAGVYKEIMHYFNTPVVTGGPVPRVKIS
jgi:ABC-type sugar transport system substrate-binding protein